MSWLLSILLASAMFAPNAGLTAELKDASADENKIVSRRIDETERFEQTYPLDANGRVGVSNVNGSITIATWDSPQVKLEYVKTADSRERLAEVTVKIDARADALRIETVYDNERQSGGRQWKNNGNLSVEYRLTVPRTAILDEIETVNGSISIANAANVTKASAVNGEIRATNLRGAATLSTVNGVVQADFDRLQTGSRITLETVNGTVDLTLPSDADATLRADTVNGSIANDFGLPVRKGQYVGKDLHGKLGAGDATVKLSSVNGGLSIKRRNDGKTVKPATNLLPPKTAGDDDAAETDGSGMPIDSLKLNRDIARAQAAAQREMRRNSAQVNRETARAVAESKVEVQRALEIVKNQINEMDVEKITADALRTAGVAENFAGAPSVEEKSGSFAVKGVPKITVDVGDAAVVARGWDKPEVAYRVVKFTEGNTDSTLNISAVNNLSDVTIKVSNVENAARRGGYYNDGGRVRVELYVPRKSDLKIGSGDGEIRLEGVSGALDLQTDDGAVSVRDAGGALRVKTADGSVRVIGFRGAFDGATGDGAMNLEGDFQSLSASSGDGTIVLTLPENANVRLESNVEIETDGVDAARENADAKVWRVGAGAAVYKMNVADGRVVVRGAAKLTQGN